MGRRFVVGIVGGVASGKSTVAGLFGERGARVLDADRLAHEVLREPGVKEAIRARFGGGVFGGDGEVDRGALAGAVFGPPSRTAELNGIVHPGVVRRLEAELEGHEGVIVLDAALLLEAGLGAMCDLVVFVEAGPERRRQRAAGRRWDSGELARREAAQAEIEAKRREAGAVIDNDGDLAWARSQVNRLFDEGIVPAPGP